jgi:hypothetical protein
MIGLSVSAWLMMIFLRWFESSRDRALRDAAHPLSKVLR